MSHTLYTMKKTFRNVFSGVNISQTSWVYLCFLTFFVRNSSGFIIFLNIFCLLCLFIVVYCSFLSFVYCAIVIFMKRFQKATLGTWGLLWQTMNLFKEGLKLFYRLCGKCYSTYLCKVKIDCCFLLDFTHPKLWS